MSFPVLSPKGKDPEQFTEVLRQILPQLNLRFSRQSADSVPQTVRDGWGDNTKEQQGEYGCIQYAFGDRSFTIYYLLPSIVDYDPQTDSVLILGVLFDDFRIRESPSYPTPETYNAVYNYGDDACLSHARALYVMLDELIPAFKAVFGEEIYQRLLWSEDDF